MIYKSNRKLEHHTTLWIILVDLCFFCLISDICIVHLCGFYFRHSWNMITKKNRILLESKISVNLLAGLGL